MNTALARPILLASASGLFYPLCFPDFDLGFLAWVFLIPLHFAVEGTSLRRAFWLGWLSGLIAFVGTMSWVVTAMNLYGNMPLVLSYMVMILLAAYLGLYIAGYALALVWFRQRAPSMAFLAAPFIWVTLELVRTYFLTGLPWCLLGYSQYRWLPVIQVADHTGVYGLSFLIVLTNAAFTDLGLWASRWVRRDRSGSLPWFTPAATALGLTVTLLYGFAQLEKTGIGKTVRIGLVQPNIDQGHKWDSAYREETLSRYHRLTVEAADRSDLVIWPEAATPFLFERELEYRSRISEMVRNRNVPLLFGSPAIGFYDDGRPYLLNSAYLLSPAGHIRGRYDKQHLVPFGEYIPLHSTLLFFLDKLVEGIGDFQAGTGPTIFEFSPTEDMPNVKFGTVICYEVIFPNLVRRFAAEGADFMTTLTNDAWFGESVAPFQHFAMVVFRAVENRTAFARSANTGVSGFIDPHGRILEATPIFRELATIGELPIGRTGTFYTQFGDVFAYACVIITGILFIAAGFGTRQGARGKG